MLALARGAARPSSVPPLKNGAAHKISLEMVRRTVYCAMQHSIEELFS
jgi:hypothetical protein